MIKQVGRYVYDVFLGTGYDNWVRVRRNTWGMQRLQGVYVSAKVLTAIGQAIENNQTAVEV